MRGEIGLEVGGRLVKFVEWVGGWVGSIIGGGGLEWRQGVWVLLMMSRPTFDMGYFELRTSADAWDANSIHVVLDQNSNSKS